MSIVEPGTAGQARGHYAAGQAAAALDAGASRLRADGSPGPDRRALVLLAGVVALLVLAITGMLRALGDGRDAGPAREQDLVIPEPPKVATVAAALPEAPPPAPPPALGLPVIPLPPVAVPPAGAAPPGADRGPSLAERRGGSSEPARAGDPYLAAMLSGLDGPRPTAPQPMAAPAPASATSAKPLQQPDGLLVRGTHIRCVLQTRIVTDIAGHTACVVTEPVYSFDGRNRLLPAGSRVLGRYEGAPHGPRVAVVWDRILTPGGLDITMASPGVDGLGGAGHPGDYDAHWGARIGSAMLVSVIGDAFKYAAAKEGPPATVIGEGGVVMRSPYESATARTLERLAGQALEVRRPPTVTIAQGTVLNIHVARDVDFSAVMEPRP